VAVGLKVIEDPVPIELVVPHAFAYQLTVPVPPTAVNVVVCPEQMVVVVAVMDVGPIGPQLIFAAQPV
jgi:hypothetical protein